MTNSSETAWPDVSREAAAGSVTEGSRADRAIWATMDVLRRHWVFALLVAAGLLLRIIVQIGYHPALLFIDSRKYIFGTEFSTSEWGSYDPIGYTLFVLRPVLMFGNLAIVALLQHLLGVGMAAALYVLLQRRGVTRWLAGLAVAPVLLDAYQLNAEQTIMPDVLFEALVVAGIVLLLWQPRPGLAFVILGGLALGTSAPVRQVGEALIVPALVYVLAATRGWRRRVLYGTVLTFCFVLPVVGYMGYSAVVLHYGFELSNMGDAYLYGRAAHAADCATLKIPADEEPLCPTPTQAVQFGVDGLVNSPYSPRVLYSPVDEQVNPPALINTLPLQKALAYSVIKQQPLRVIGDIAKDSVKVFALTRDTDEGDTPISRWQFQTSYPYYRPGITPYGYNSANNVFKKTGGGTASVYRPAAILLRDYQLYGGYTPGPVFLLALLAGIAGIFSWRRRRDPSGRASQDQSLACLLIVGSAVAVLLGADLYEFSWRYQLPALITLPIAGALGATAVAGRIRQRRLAKVAAAEVAATQDASLAGTTSPVPLANGAGTTSPVPLANGAGTATAVPLSNGAGTATAVPLSNGAGAGKANPATLAGQADELAVAGSEQVS